ncbi:hypothetical protein H4R99_005942 [Coemansia sp. RSA 1722]|nr:hypothetical protein H4R99_005942 [Coemansia sp. RSA 1722]
MGDNSSGTRSKQGRQGSAGSPLRIYTRATDGNGAQDNTVSKTREAATEHLSSAFSRPYDAESASGINGGDAQAAGKANRVAPRVGRHGAPYHPLPSHWRELESGSSSVGSPVTPDSGGGDDLLVARSLQPMGQSVSQPGAASTSQPVALTIDPSRSYHNPRDLQQAKAKALGQSPLASPRIQIGALREAFGSSSSLEWSNERPGSTYSCQSTDVNAHGYLSEIQAESPLDAPAHGGRFPPSLSSMAARPNAMRGALTVHHGASRHHASASTSSSHYSFAVNSPPIRGAGSTAQFASSKDPSQQTGHGATALSPTSLGVADEPATAQSEDIVRKYLGLQRRSASASGAAQAVDLLQTQTQQQQKARHQQQSPMLPSSSSPVPAHPKPSAIAPRGPSASAATTTASSADSAGGPVEESSGSIVYRRAVSSGDLPTLEDLHESMQSSMASNSFDNRNFLTPDLVESPLEALVRRLTIELFQLYVNEDRRKSGKGQAVDDARHPHPQTQAQAQAQSRTHMQHSKQQPQPRQQAKQPGGGDEYEGFDDVDDSIRAGYVQQFRLGPSMRSGSSTPAVTMDGYFVPHKAEPTASASASATVAATAAASAESTAESEARPRPRHRLIQRTWMEEALLKARRVSTIDENAEESILEALTQDSDFGSSMLNAPVMPAAHSDASKTPSPVGRDDLAQFNLNPPAGDAATGAPRVAQRGQAARLFAAAVTREAAQRRPSGDSGVHSRIDLSPLGEESADAPLDARPEGVFSQHAGGHIMSPRGFYRARDPAAPHRKLPSAERRPKDRLLASSISPARASLLRAVGRRQSVRLQPGKGQIVVAETQMGARAPSPEQAADRYSGVGLGEPDAMSRAKRANSLPGLMQVPETREVSYKDQQRKAARQVEMRKSRRSRARMVHRAERMMLGGSQPAGSRGNAARDARRPTMHRRAASRVDMDQQLVKVELPPPVPLRVRREQVKIVPEPLIIVRQLAKGSSGASAATSGAAAASFSARSLPQQQQPGETGTAEQQILRVHNQLLGAQAVLSRHNSIMRTATLRKQTGGRGGASGAAGGRAAAAGRSAMRNEALDVVMLDNALDERLEDAEKQRFAEARERRRRDRRERAKDGAAETEDSESAAIKPWRNARRRSTLRKRGQGREQGQHRAQAQNQDQAQVLSQAQAQAQVQAVSVPQSLPPARRLLLHGPAYRIYSGIKARPDTYLFLFSDVLVVATRLGQAVPSLGADSTSVAVMAAPSSDAGALPADARFRVHIAIPLARGTTALKTARDIASKRAGEDDDAAERRLVRQEERIRRACHVFEKNTSEAVVYLINRDIIDPVPDTVAGFLYRCTALSRRQLGSFLGSGILGENLHENPTADEIEQEKLFHRQIWVAFLDRCNIVGVPLDEALRAVLFLVRLPSNTHAINVLLEIAALQWYAKNVERGAASGVYVPDSPDTAVKLAFAIMTLSTELHNPLLRADTQPDAAYRELLLKFRASVVDDPAVAAKRKGNVLRKRDQPRVVTVMEVPPDHLRAVYDRVSASRLVTCSDARPAAPEVEVDWVRDASDVAAPPLSDDAVDRDIEEVYCDPGFRDGALFNASSDRLPAKLSIDPPAWLRVTIRIPEPDPKFTVRVRVLSAPADAGAAAQNSDVVAIVPANWLSFRTANSASFIVRPLLVGHVTLHFVAEGANARFYHPIPSRTLVVEGAFMRNTVQVSWRRADDAATRARYMFGMDSQPTKARWVHALQTALKASAEAPTMDVLARVDRASRALAALVPSPPDHSRFVADKLDADQAVTAQQILAALAAP